MQRILQACHEAFNSRFTPQIGHLNLKPKQHRNGLKWTYINRLKWTEMDLKMASFLCLAGLRTHPLLAAPAPSQPARIRAGVSTLGVAIGLPQRPGLHELSFFEWKTR